MQLNFLLKFFWLHYILLMPWSLLFCSNFFGSMTSRGSISCSSYFGSTASCLCHASCIMLSCFLQHTSCVHAFLFSSDNSCPLALWSLIFKVEEELTLTILSLIYIYWPPLKVFLPCKDNLSTFLNLNHLSRRWIFVIYLFFAWHL